MLLWLLGAPSAWPPDDMTSDDSLDPSLLSDTLPAGVRVREQIIEGFIRSLPEGRLYRVQHATTGAQAMLLEYLPEAWVRRVGENVSVIPGRGPEFRAGMQRFLLRAQQLKAMSHPSLPHLIDLIPSHGTAFAVYPLANLRTLAEVVEQAGGRLPLSQVWPWLNACSDLAQWLHDQGRIHGGFDPHAVWVLDDDRLLLPPPELEEGYRPPSPWVALEQTVLASSGTPRGPWTDVYGVGALASFMLTGQGPKSATRRAMAAPRPPGSGPGWVDSRSAALDPIPGVLKAAIRVSLMPNPRERPQDIGQFRAMLGLAEQMSGQGSGGQDGFLDTDTGDSGFGALAGDPAAAQHKMNRDAQRAFARALQPHGALEADAGPKRQAATILQDRPGPTHIPTLVMPLPAQLPATMKSSALDSDEGSTAEGADVAGRVGLREQALTLLSASVARPPEADVGRALADGLQPTQPAAWSESRDMPETRPLTRSSVLRSEPAQRIRRGPREMLVAGVAVLGLLATWWLVEPRSPSAASSGSAARGPSTQAPVGVAVSTAALPATATADATAAVPAAPPAPLTPASAAAVAKVEPERVASLDPDALLRAAAPAAGKGQSSPVAAEAPASQAAQTPPAALTAKPSTGLPSPAPRSSAPAQSLAQASVAKPAAKPVEGNAGKCRQALLEKSLGFPRGADDVGKFCR